MDAEEIDALAATKVDPKSIQSSNDNKSSMTLKERWHRTMYYQKPEQIPNWEFGYWAETLPQWQEQGMPAWVKGEGKAYKFFGIENWKTVYYKSSLNPFFETEVISRDDKYEVYKDGNGATCQINVEGYKSIPHYLDFGLKTRADWKKWLDRLDPDPISRLPANWDELVVAYNKTDDALGVNSGSLIGIPRNWIGFENIALMTYDDPQFIEEIVERLCVIICNCLEKICSEVKVDFSAGWEDICFNSGPIVSPNFMREVVLPRYQRITKVLRKHGVGISWTDCDGNLNPIADIFLEGGINCMFPVEVNAGTDPVALRERFGTDMRFQGGFCKMKFLESAEAIDAELLRLKPVVDEGGFIPGVDHRVQADAPLNLYMYYLKRKRELYNVGGEPMYDESKVNLVNGVVEIPDLSDITEQILV
jgi:hypothetical protein